MVLAVCLLVVLAAPAGQGAQLRLEQDRVWLRAEAEPLVSVLEEFARLGVRVEVDPDLRTWVTARAEGEPLEAVLEEILGENSYALIWNVVEGPLGRWPRLSGLRVFQPGHEQDTAPLAPARAGFDVTPDRPGNPSHVRDELLIGLKPGTTPAQFRDLLARIHGTVVESLPDPGIYRIRLPAGTDVPALVRRLRQASIAAEVEPNFAYRLPGAGGAAAATGGTDDTSPAAPGTGEGSAVAILDSGLAAQDSLAGAVRGRYDALNPDGELTDTVGHGTQMALIAAGAVSPHDGTKGSAVPIVAIRAFDEQGRSSGYDLMRAVQYAGEQEARVINMSWGSGAESAFMKNVLDGARARGALLVAAAGNEPTGEPVYPAAYPNVLAVGATMPGGGIWERSNTGEFVDLTAPGAASLPVGYNGPPGSYAGTSIASAYVSHILGRYASAHPDADPSEVLQRLQQSLTDRGDAGPDPVYGFGVLDARAVQRFLGE